MGTSGASIATSMSRQNPLTALSGNMPTQPAAVSSLFGPWWPEESEGIYLAQEFPMSDDEVGILPDTGAHDGLCGSLWARTQAQKCQAAGKHVGQKLLNVPRSVQGVGNGSQQAQYEVSLAAGIQDTEGRYYEEKYKAPCLEGSGIPGLMGIISLERNDALIRCKTGEMWFLGPGGAEIKASPGSRHFQMRKAKSGHWMLPISRFNQAASSGGITLNTEDATASGSVTDAPAAAAEMQAISASQRTS